MHCVFGFFNADKLEAIIFSPTDGFQQMIQVFDLTIDQFPPWLIACGPIISYNLLLIPGPYDPSYMNSIISRLLVGTIGRSDACCQVIRDVIMSDRFDVDYVSPDLLYRFFHTIHPQGISPEMVQMRDYIIKHRRVNRTHLIARTFLRVVHETLSSFGGGYKYDLCFAKTMYDAYPEAITMQKVGDLNEMIIHYVNFTRHETRLREIISQPDLSINNEWEINHHIENMKDIIEMLNNVARSMPRVCTTRPIKEAQVRHNRVLSDVRARLRGIGLESILNC